MTFYIGGHFNGKEVEQDYLDRKELSIQKPYGPYTGFERKSESYIKKQVTFQGETKTMYLLRGKTANDLRNQIVAIWDRIDCVDIYSID